MRLRNLAGKKVSTYSEPAHFFEKVTHIQPVKLLVLGYITLTLLGFALLSIPLFHQTRINPLDNLFMATSAISTTGLGTISVADNYNLAGQVVIALLIQIGGIGYMAIGSFAILGIKRDVSHLEEDLIKSDFSLPDDFDTRSFIQNVILFSLAAETVGAVILYLIFRGAGEANPLWQAIFHSVSAFSTAGFSLFNDSFEGYRDHLWLNLTIATLSYAGAVGFIVFTDVWLSLTNRKEQVTYTSKIILFFTLVTGLIGISLTYISEPTLQTETSGRRLLAAFFQTMTALSTVGFNTVPIISLSQSVLFLLTLMMIIGASPAGTGGGIKSTTITAVFAEMMSAFQGKDETVFWRQQIPEHRVRVATANLVFYVILLCIGIYLLAMAQPQPLYPIIFEAVSALGTVGLSMGLTNDLTGVGKLIVILLMFAGRVGSLSLGTALFGKDKAELRREAIEEEQGEDLAI